MTGTRLAAVAAACALLGAVACGGGGPGVRGPEATALFERFNGVWVLDPEGSDAPTDPTADDGGRGGLLPGLGGRPGIGGTRVGGVPGGGGFGPGGGGLSPGATRATLELIRNRPERLLLDLSDSIFAVAEAPGAQYRVPMSGDQIALPGRVWPTKAKVEWKDRTPSFKREVEDGGTVIDRYELVAPDRLLVTRWFSALPVGRGDEVRFAYDRRGSDAQDRSARSDGVRVAGPDPSPAEAR